MIRTLISCLIVLCATAAAPAKDNQAIIPFQEGSIRLTFLNDNAVRVEYAKEFSDTLPEWIYVNESPRTGKLTKTELQNGTTRISAGKIKADIDRNKRAVTITDAQGRPVFTTRDITLYSTDNPDGTRDTGAQLSWDNSADEHLYGLGQFQDGFTDIKGLSRRLTQVNTQISIPFILSNKGYGILWNNYGLTEYNPGSTTVTLSRSEKAGAAREVNITTTEGARMEVRRDNTFTGVIDIPESGDYSILLDVGQKMARRHNLTIDGKTIMDQRNLWLPPTSSSIVTLTKGKHELSANLERGDNPTVTLKKLDGTSTLRSPMPAKADFTVFTGTPDEIIASFRSATGHAPMMPEWALGYIHCRERFHSQDELLSNAAEFRKREIPVDVIVQDWQYWGKHGWNSMQFDEDAYPDPKAMVDSLHGMDMRLMLSVWSKIDKNSPVGKEADAKGYYIPGSDWIDFFNPEASQFYWNNFSKRLLMPYEIDAWWQDATEPENDDLEGRRVMNGRYRGELFRNVYPLLVNRTVYEGCRTDMPQKRTMILTRCGFPGIQRYGAAMWTGDVGNDWETFRRQIASGLSMAASGMPWWTYDAGGFFRPGDQYTNDDYIQRMIRWIQAGTFMPLMRVHGFTSETEPWRYGAEAERIIGNAIKWRYRLLPYIYSLSHKVSSEGYTMMRPLVFDYPDDKNALAVKHDYMLGGNLLILPVTEPSITSRTAYLPAAKGGWYDLYDNSHLDGGREHNINVTMENIPVYVKAGSILPMSHDKQYTGDLKDEPLEIAIYTGNDGEFSLYEDEGDNYNYENGACSTIDMKWNDKSRTLEIASRKGSYPGMNKNRKFNITVNDQPSRTIDYNGNKTTLKL